MASVYKRTRSPYWWASIIGPDQNRRNISLKLEHDEIDYPTALAVANELEHLSSIVNRPDFHRVGDVRSAEKELRAVGLISSDKKPARKTATTTNKRTTIKEAALAHPTAINERASGSIDSARHIRELNSFLEWSGIRYLDELTAAHLTKYRAHLQFDLNHRPDTIRHKLLYIKCAVAMSGAYGSPIFIPRTVNRTAKAPRRIEAWTETEVAKILKHLKKQTDPRPLAFAGLMIFCGLSPGEARQLTVENFDGSSINITRAKNHFRKRALPLPKTVAKWVSSAMDQPDNPQHALIGSRHPRRRPGAEFGITAMSHFFENSIADLETVQQLPAKHGRKTFSTLAQTRWNLPEGHRKKYLGHAPNDVEGRHYFAGFTVEDLQPTAKLIQRQITRILK